MTSFCMKGIEHDVSNVYVCRLENIAFLLKNTVCTGNTGTEKSAIEYVSKQAFYSIFYLIFYFQHIYQVTHYKCRCFSYFPED